MEHIGSVVNLSLVVDYGVLAGLLAGSPGSPGSHFECTTYNVILGSRSSDSCEDQHD